MEQGTLYIAATPIGNLSDVSPHLTSILQKADYIAAEDTRRTKTLCNHLEISKPNLLRCDEAKEEYVAQTLIDHLENGQNVALVSDAGTPCISDPGWKLVEMARQKGLNVEPIPGPSAITSAISVSGFPGTPFMFYGFLDKKKSKSIPVITSMFKAKHTSVFFESPYRIEKTLGQMIDIEPSRIVFMIREISKKFEQSHYGSPLEIQENIKTLKGEWTIVISPNHDRFRR